MCTSVYNFYVTHCVACFSEISLGVSSKFPKHIGNKFSPEIRLDIFQIPRIFPYFPGRLCSSHPRYQLPANYDQMSEARSY